MHSCVLQVWLQEFAWTEDEKAAKVERRDKDGPQGRQLAKEPMFCFEFAMNMLYWSALVYDYGEVCPLPLLPYSSCEICPDPCLLTNAKLHP